MHGYFLGRERFSGHKELKKLKDWLQEFPHVNVLDFFDSSEGYGLNEFMDLTHLNESGARRFSKRLRNELQSLGFADFLQ